MPPLRALSALLFVTALGAVSCGSGSDGPPPYQDPVVRTVTASEAAELVAAGKAVLVDVREAYEIAEGMAEPARWMPSTLIPGQEWHQFVATIPVDREAIFYCSVGGRSQRAALTMATIGYKTANMGGFDSWQKAGLPVKKPVKPEIGK